MKHQCHAILCTTEVHPRFLMCRRHWSMVPRHIQKLVWETYVPGQEVRKDPTDAYMLVHLSAVVAVAEAEGLGDHPQTVRTRQARDSY